VTAVIKATGLGVPKGRATVKTQLPLIMLSAVDSTQLWPGRNT